MTETINYGRLMHRAMRGLIVEVLEQVAREGLPGDHHFYITFDTTHPGVDMHDSLMARYPAEMTVVMQDWFSDLAVMPDRFTVTLNFGNKPEPIVIPFEAIRTFVDPSVEFGLKFDAHDEDADLEWELEDDSGDDGENDEAPASEAQDSGSQVVSLDKFRKT